MDVVRSWKDPEYRASLPSAPENPAGIVELPESDMSVAGGSDLDSRTIGHGTCELWSMGCCGPVIVF